MSCYYMILRLQGYKVSSCGKVESEDMFLHRVCGIVRLYAAIVGSPQLPMDHVHAHPHGLNHGWTWLARVVNMEPHPTLTAAALGDFLEVRLLVVWQSLFLGSYLPDSRTCSDEEIWQAVQKTSVYLVYRLHSKVSQSNARMLSFPSP